MADAEAPNQHSEKSIRTPWWLIAFAAVATCVALALVVGFGYLAYWESTCAEGYDSIDGLRGSPPSRLAPPGSEEIGLKQGDCGRSIFAEDTRAYLVFLHGSNAELEELQSWYEARMSDLGWAASESNSRAAFERSGGSRGKILSWSKDGRQFRVEIRTEPTSLVAGRSYEAFWMDPAHPNDERETHGRMGDFDTLVLVEYLGSSDFSRGLAQTR